MSITREDALAGCILGTALGDAVGLPCEGLSRQRQHKLFRHSVAPTLFLGRRMVSDDTEHTLMTAQALIASEGKPAQFQREFARLLRRWFLTLPAGSASASRQQKAVSHRQVMARQCAPHFWEFIATTCNNFGS